MQRLFRNFLGPVLGAAICTAAQADDAAFDSRVRAYILANPEIILEALTILSEREAEAAMRQQVAAYPQLFSDPPQLGMGAPGAGLRVVEFFDYKCMPCKAVHPVLEKFVETHPNVRIEMRHLPILTPGSERAARFALAVREVAGEQMYARAHDRLWDIRGPLNAAGFKRISTELNLPYDKIAARMESAEITARINYNRDAAIAMQILGTPAFVTPESVTVGQTDIDVLAANWLNQ